MNTIEREKAVREPLGSRVLSRYDIQIHIMSGVSGGLYLCGERALGGRASGEILKGSTRTRGARVEQTTELLQDHAFNTCSQ
ncbi:hypothetical protein J6590_059523 [Homalodisca vitripennis]|nr:hypothetical protein J6590_059523 [Homalodisca vitripennis]